MPDLSIKDQIKKVVELQKIDGEIYSLKVQLKEKPVVLEQLKAEFESHKETLTALEEKLKAIQLDRKEKELELNTQRQKLRLEKTEALELQERQLREKFKLEFGITD